MRTTAEELADARGRLANLKDKQTRLSGAELEANLAEQVVAEKMVAHHTAAHETAETARHRADEAALASNRAPWAR